LPEPPRLFRLPLIGHADEHYDRTGDTLVMPATMAPLGKWNWYLPRWPA
jgi:hypothetical protein